MVRPETPAPPKVWNIEDILFPKQLKFVQDPHPFKTAVCSRRAGKTIACAADLIDTALKHEGVNCLYITLSRNSAKKLIWRELLKMIREYNLKVVSDATELSITFANGSIIYVSGAKDATEIEKFRGLPFKLVYIDECQSFRPYIEDLVDDVIAPALMDYDGTLALIGTPGAIPAGFFAEVAGVVQEKIDASKAWTHHHWTFFDNPYIALKSKKNHQQLLDRELRRRGVTMDDPTIQREWFGKWVLDTDALWIHYSREKNDFGVLPVRPDGSAYRWHYIMGIDLGFIDADAIAVLAYCDEMPTAYLVEEEVVTKQGLTELVEAIQELRSRYDVVKMVIDEGGLGKKLAEEMRRRHGIPVQAADKARKQENVAFMNDALRTGRLMVRAASQFAQDSYLVEIDRAKSRPDKIVVSNKYHSDIIDAVLYAFRESPNYAWEPKEEKPQPGTPAWAKKEEDRMFEAAQEHFQEQAEQLARMHEYGG